MGVSSESQKNKRDYSLDIIRIIAIMMIFTFHYCCTYQLFESPFYIMANGGWGCPGSTVFFVLSGYLLRARYPKINSLKDFYKKRFLSIFPPFYIAFFVCYILMAARNHSLFYAGNPLNIIFTLLGIDNYMSFYGIPTYAVVGEWFTAIIVAVYLVYPLLTRIYNHLKWSVILIITGLYLTNAFIGIDPVIADASIFSGIFLFMAGMVISDYIEFLRKHYWCSFIFLGLAILIVFVPIGAGIPKVVLSNTLGISIFSFLVIILSKIQVPEKPGKIVVYLSTVSYCVYLTHHFIMNKLYSVLAPHITSTFKHILCYLAMLILTIFTSIALYHITDFILKKLIPNKKTP